jgi:Ras-related GTP-binding protein A/B
VAGLVAARDTLRLGATIDVEHSHVRFLGNLMLNLWDCGGQENFMLSYFESQKEHIFRHVHVLIYVFDIESTVRQSPGVVNEPKDYDYFVSCLRALQQHNQRFKVFCLIHKMDLVAKAERDAVFREQQAELRRLAAPYAAEVTSFATSIWDASLYKAWSTMVHSLIPNVPTLETQLRNFCRICKADEVVLFERATFLVICHATAAGSAELADVDPHRFEKISNIIKQFKLSCSKSQTQFEKMEVQNSRFTAFVDVFTSNTYLMAVMSPSADPACAMEPAVPLSNIALVRQHFEQIVAPAASSTQGEPGNLDSSAG